jgi:transposase-like protein
VDFLREGVQVLAQALVDADASRRIGAEPYERSVQRQTHRNGYRDPGRCGIMNSLRIVSPPS